MKLHDQNYSGDLLAHSAAPQTKVVDENHFWNKLLRISKEMHAAQDALAQAISGAATAQEAKNLRRRLARRIVLKGYPKIGPFETMEQIEHYLKGAPDGHTCLICGRVYRALGIHLALLHSIDLDEYRDQYRLPRSFGLACEESKALYRGSLEERIAAGTWDCQRQAEAGRKNIQRNSREGGTFKRISTISRQQRVPDEDYWHIIEIMRAEAMTLREASSKHNMGEIAIFRHWNASFRLWMAKDATRKRAFVKAVEALPFTKQAEMKMLGKRYRQVLIALRRDGKTIDEIAAIVGIGRCIINAHLRKLDPNHKKIVRYKTHCPKGHMYQFSTSKDGKSRAKCQTCNTENKRIKRKEHEANNTKEIIA